MHAVIETNRGTISFRMQEKDAPKTCANFVKLAQKGFYDNLTWHRVIDNFVIQGGCPKGDGTGGPGYTIDAELSEQKHVKGTVAMARGSTMNSAGSQFYIARTALPHLDKQYTVFGQVTAGFDVIDKIKQGDAIKKVSIVAE
jgi:cyclophilin family peptidyl-prolyl cis-trans isomerase